MAFRIQIRRDTTVNWAATNPILLEAELGLDLTTNCLKIGDGVTRWNSLPTFVCLGASGTSGTSGTSSTSGSGSSGTSGSSGSSGTSGSSGSSGTSGSSGSSGTSGTSGVTNVQSIGATAASTAINLNSAEITILNLDVSTELNLTVSSPGVYIIQVVQGSGGQTLTYSNTIYWSGGLPPTLTTTAGYSDIITLIYNGSILLGAYNLNFSTP